MGLCYLAAGMEQRLCRFPGIANGHERQDMVSCRQFHFDAFFSEKPLGFSSSQSEAIKGNGKLRFIKISDAVVAAYVGL